MTKGPATRNDIVNDCVSTNVVVKVTVPAMDYHPVQESQYNCTLIACAIKMKPLAIIRVGWGIAPRVENNVLLAGYL